MRFCALEIFFRFSREEIIIILNFFLLLYFTSNYLRFFAGVGEAENINLVTKLNSQVCATNVGKGLLSAEVPFS